MPSLPSQIHKLTCASRLIHIQNRWKLFSASEKNCSYISKQLTCPFMLTFVPMTALNSHSNASLYALVASTYTESHWKMFAIPLASIIPYKKRGQKPSKGNNWYKIWKHVLILCYQVVCINCIDYYYPCEYSTIQVFFTWQLT